MLHHLRSLLVLKERSDSRMSIYEENTEYSDWVYPQLYDPLWCQSYSGVAKFLKKAQVQDKTDDNIRIMLGLKA
jgi:hypothetical protein